MSTANARVHIVELGFNHGFHDLNNVPTTARVVERGLERDREIGVIVSSRTLERI